MRRKSKPQQSIQQNRYEVIEYSYRSPLLLTLVLFAGFGAGAYAVFFEAMNNTRGMLISHTIHLGVQGATSVLWTIFACSLMLALAGAFLFFRDVFTRPTLILDHQVLRIPAQGLRCRQKEIPLAGIEGMEILTATKKTFLAIWHADGYDHVMASHLPDKAAFEHFVQAMYARTPRL